MRGRWTWVSRVVLLGVLTGLTGMFATPDAAAAPVTDLGQLPAVLQKYVPGSAAWAASPWMTSPACGDRGGDFSVWSANVITDTPSLLAFFQSSAFGAEVEPQDKPRSDAIIQGYQALAVALRPSIPADYCVDDLRRWAGADPQMKPFGFPWGVTVGDGHQSSYFCTDRDPNATRDTEVNRWFGAERGMCDGFYVACVNAQDVEKNRCEAWNNFSDRYVLKVEQLRAAAINEHPASGQADTHTRLKSMQEILQGVTGHWFQEMTLTLAQGATRMIAEAMTFWTRSDSTSMLTSPAIAEIQGLLRYVGIVLLAGGMIWQGIMMMYRRKLDPLVSTGMGLLSFVGWSTLGGTAAVLLDQAGTALADQVLDEKIGRFSETMGLALVASVIGSAGAVFLLSIVLFFLACVQWALGFFRMGALVILLGLIPTAAAGQVNEGTKPWLRKVLSWALALVLYKPVAAIVFSIGFSLMSDGASLSTVLVGMAVLALAVLSMPTMLRFFDWGGQRFVGSGSGGGGVMAAGAAASVLGGAGAGGFSRFMDHSGPASGRGGDKPGAVEVASAHSGDGPGDAATTDQSMAARSGAAGTQSATTAGGGSAAPSAGVSSATGTAAAGTGATAGAGAASSGSTGAAGGAAAGGAAAAAGPAGAAVAAAAAVKQSADQAIGVAAGAMTDGAGSNSS